MRRSLPKEEKERLDRLISQRLLKLPAWRKADLICLYMSLADEISTYPILEAAWTEGKEVYLPVTCGKGEMIFCQCNSLGELYKGSFGIMEPIHGKPLNPALAPDLLIVPGLAFDANGYRLGYGGGYYDRFFTSYPLWAGQALGVAYDFQLMPSIPHELHDVKLDYLLTERGISRCRI